MAVLAFDGLDTFATVKLNGEEILSSDNMWIAHRVDVSKHLQKGSKNMLEIEFDSALLRAREIEKQHPEHVWTGFNGETARLAVRKAQYHWGWDWGPVLNTCGPWMPVRLEVYKSRVADLWTDVDLEKDLKAASVQVHARLEGQHGGSAVIRIGLKGKTVAEEKVDVGDDGVAHATFKVQSPDLWYPHGYGTQQRYEISAAIMDGTTEVHSVTKKIGLRKAELVQQPDKHGKSFYFRINNVDVFCVSLIHI